MKIGIIGGGYVGLHTALRLAQTNKDWDIRILDIDEEKINRFNSGKSPIDDFFMQEFISDNPSRLKKIKYEKPNDNWEDYDIIFISLSTNPTKEEPARLNTQLIFDLVKEISNSGISVVVRSTINIDDSDKLESLGGSYWPEFLSQGVGTLKNINQPVNIVALREKDSTAFNMFEELFNGKTLIKSNIREAIMIKIVHNTLDAHLISLTNLFANISEENNIDFHRISHSIETLLSNRPKVKKPGIGFGGSCYPKDSYSLIEMTTNKNNRDLIESLDRFNKSQSLSFLTKEAVIKSSKNIVVLGTSFKGGTNDVVKTPTLGVRRWLLDNNIEYKVWEPMISEKWTLENEIISEDIVADIKAADLVIVASDWTQFNELLINYNKTVIDLKSFIKENGKMTIHKIGKKTID